MYIDSNSKQNAGLRCRMGTYKSYPVNSIDIKRNVSTSATYQLNSHLSVSL